MAPRQAVLSPSRPDPLPLTTYGTTYSACQHSAFFGNRVHHLLGQLAEWQVWPTLVFNRARETVNFYSFPPVGARHSMGAVSPFSTKDSGRIVFFWVFGHVVFTVL